MRHSHMSSLSDLTVEDMNIYMGALLWYYSIYQFFFYVLPLLYLVVSIFISRMPWGCILIWGSAATWWTSWLPLRSLNFLEMLMGRNIVLIQLNKYLVAPAGLGVEDIPHFRSEWDYFETGWGFCFEFKEF